MGESRSQQDDDPKNGANVIKSVRIKKPKRVIRTKRVRQPVREPSTAPTVSSSPLQAIPESKAAPAAPQKPEITPVDSHLYEDTSLWEGATSTSRSSFRFLDRICHPAIQYKLFLSFLSIWGASFILFYLSTSFALILPDPFNLVVLGFFIVSTSLSGLYTFLLGIQHLRSTRQSSDDSYY